MKERKKFNNNHPLLLLGSLLSGLGDFATLAIGLLNGLDNTNSHSLPHVTNGEATERWVFIVSLNTHGLGRHELDDCSIARLDSLGGSFNDLAGTTIDLLDELSELAGNVGSVAIQNGSITSTNLTGVIDDDNLGSERSGFLGRIVLRVGSDVATTNILDRNVLDVETDVVTRQASLKLFVVHFHRLDFRGHVGWSKSDDHASLNSSSFDTTDRDSSNTTDLVDILERKSERLIGWT